MRVNIGSPIRLKGLVMNVVGVGRRSEGIGIGGRIDISSGCSAMAMPRSMEQMAKKDFIVSPEQITI
jgi:hypothetical protein